MQNDPSHRVPISFKVVFAIIAGAVAAVLIMLSVLRVNEVVEVEGGELIAKLPRVVCRAPYDVTVARVLVREGDSVRPLDTLLVLENPDVVSQFISVREAYEASLVKREILLGLIENASQRIENLRAQLQNQVQVLHLNKDLYRSELEALSARLEATGEQMSIADGAFARDSTLYARALLSQAEFERSRSTWLNSVREGRALQSDYDSRAKQYEKLEPEAALEATRLRMEMLNAEAELLQLRQRQAELEAALGRERSEVRAHREAFEKQYVVAEVPGSVHFLYNTKASSNLVSKGEVLVDVVPFENNVYARLQLRQDQVKEVAVGQRVHLKLDAFYYFKYGVVEGQVGYVSAPDNQNNFYVNVEVQDPENGLDLKPGYRVSAEIIQDRVALYEFVFRRIFGRPEPSPQNLPDAGSPKGVVQAGDPERRTPL